MAKTRLYQPIPLKPQTSIQLDERGTHYLGTVLRVRKDEEIILFNGEGGEYQSRIIDIKKKEITVYLEKFIDRNPESPLQICLAQGISKGEKMDFTIQKAVELGVHSIVPLITARCNVRLAADRLNKKLMHWQAIAVSAAEQSGRIVVPIIYSPSQLEGWIKIKRDSINFVLSPHASVVKKAQLPPKFSSLTLLIGPEGGLSENEINQAIKENFSFLMLGPRILRTETAGLAAISIFQSQFGDMNF